MKVKLSYPLPVDTGLRFAVREGGKTIAAGVISEILPNEESDKTLGFAKKIKAKEWYFLNLLQ